MKPLCFVLMPFGQKPDQQGRVIDFDAIYRNMIAVAAEQADIEPIRADEEQIGGSIHKPMFERLLLCEFAIADLTTANPNVYYELGVRHAARPRSTAILFCEGTYLPFDVAPLRGMPYRIDANGMPVDVERHVAALSQRLQALKQDHSDDSPVFQMVDGMPRIELDHRNVDIFRQRERSSKELKDLLLQARKKDRKAVDAIAADPRLKGLQDIEGGILVDLFLSYRAVKAFDAMLEIHGRMPEPLRRMRLVQEQRAWALNQLKRRDEAEQVLKQLIAEHGPSSETNGLLGRVYKDLWQDADKAGDRIRAAGQLKRAIEAYVAGFEADWRDPYPGVNAVTLMELQDKRDPRQSEMLPVVRYAASRRARGPAANYWDHATLVELAVIAGDQEAAIEALESALALAPDQEQWAPESTARNLGIIRERRARAGEDAAWIAELEAELMRASERPREAHSEAVS